MRMPARVLLLSTLIVAACGPPQPTLTPAGVADFKANEVVVSLGTLQRTAIALNAIQVCEPTPCRPLFSDKNTRIVIDAVEVSLKTIQAVPSGWKTAATVALSGIRAKLDAAGLQKITPYIVAAETILAEVSS